MKSNGNANGKSFVEKLHDIPALEALLQRATRDAIRQHALAGNPIAIWHEDRLVVEVPKLEDYPLEDETS